MLAQQLAEPPDELAADAAPASCATCANAVRRVDRPLDVGGAAAGAECAAGDRGAGPEVAVVPADPQFGEHGVGARWRAWSERAGS